MKTGFFWLELILFDLEDAWLQQDDANCQTSCETIELLQGKFPGPSSINADQN